MPDVAQPIVLNDISEVEYNRRICSAIERLIDSGFILTDQGSADFRKLLASLEI